MRYKKHASRFSIAALLSFVIAAVGVPVALGQSAAPPMQAPPTAAPAPISAASSSPMVNLLNLLTQRGVLTPEEASALAKQATDEAAVQRGSPPPAPEGTVRVPYVPEIVKKEIREEVKNDVMAQARQENWAAPDQVPPWVQKLRIYGDFRARAEADLFPNGSSGGFFPNFNAINTGPPLLLGVTNTPQRNADQDRYRLRLRARLGVDADLGDDFTTGLRIASGETNSPVSANQSLGAASGQGGNFSKYAIWLDRAYLKYEPVNEDGRLFRINVGRFDNPFFSTNLIWADDLGFDGVSSTTKFRINDSESNFFTVGAFPVFNTDFNYSTNANVPGNLTSNPSYDKWLFGAQYGTDWKVNPEVTTKLGAAYYHFLNVEGKLSSPCSVQSAADTCDTDASRPTFAQFGNTYRPLRNIIDCSATCPSPFEFQYFGLATPFRELALTGRVDLDHYDPFRISIDGEFVKNLAFNRGRIQNIASNNVQGDGPRNASNVPGNFEGGDTGYYLNLTAGARKLEKFGDWRVSLGYKYLESDAVVDGLTDSDFGLGGTNLKGFILGGSYAITKNVWTNLKWSSADSIAGPPFRVDVVQLDLQARF